jgi:hypothetical protein
MGIFQASTIPTLRALRLKLSTLYQVGVGGVAFSQIEERFKISGNLEFAHEWGRKVIF